MRHATPLLALALVTHPLAGQQISGAPLPSRGVVRGVILPVVQGEVTPTWSTDAMFRSLVGSPGSPGTSPEASVTSYLWIASQGTFRWEADIAPIMVDVANPKGLDPMRQRKATTKLIRNLLAEHASQIDFARYDNDGVDGLPASADDDGIIDALIIAIDDPRMPMRSVYIPDDLGKVKTSRGDMRVRGAWVIHLGDPGQSLIGREMVRSLSVGWGLNADERGVLPEASEDVFSTTALARLGWRDVKRIAQSGTYDLNTDIVAAVPLVDVPDGKGQWLIRQVGNETDLTRVLWLGAEKGYRTVAHLRATREQQIVTIPLTATEGVRGPSMTLTWPGGDTPTLTVSLQAERATSRK
jgi:hypothetical protein